MRLEQSAVFQPITITLTTAEEAQAMWRLLELGAQNVPKAGDIASLVEREVANSICDWFSTQAQLNGRTP